MKTAFDQQVRVLACPECAGPIEVGLAGGTVRCSYCRASLVVGARHDRKRAQSTLGEAERYQRLRQQAGEALTIPASIRGLLGPDQQLPDGKVEEASRHWQALRVRLLAAGRDSFTLQEELLHLTLLLEPKLRQHGLKTRALLETALELLDDPTHEQVIRGLVVQDALRVGELQAAASWLEGLDPCSSSIHADSAYRIAAATLAAARKAAEEIRLLLGDQLESMPLAFDAQAPAAVLRAHAYELDGALQVAELQLSAALAGSPPGLRERSGLSYASICHYRATAGLPFALCPLTFERALSNVAPAIPEPAPTPLVQAQPRTTADLYAEVLRLASPPQAVGPPPPAPRACPAEKVGVSAFVAILFGLLVVGSCVLVLTTMPPAVLDATWRVFFIGFGAVGLALFLSGVISALRQWRLYVTGTPAQARVLELSMGIELGGDNSSRPLWRVKYQYHAGGAVLTGTCRTLSAPPARGSVMWVLYDPKRPERSMSA